MTGKLSQLKRQRENGKSLSDYLPRKKQGKQTNLYGNLGSLLTSGKDR